MTLAFLYLLDRVASECSVTREQILSKERTTSVAEARAVAVYCCGKFLNLSPEQMKPLFKRSHQNLYYLREKVRHRPDLIEKANKVLQ